MNAPNRKPGRPKKPDEDKGKQVGLRLPQSLITQIDRIRDGRTWPAGLKMMADHWDRTAAKYLSVK